MKMNSPKKGQKKLSRFGRHFIGANLFLLKDVLVKDIDNRKLI